MMRISGRSSVMPPGCEAWRTDANIIAIVVPIVKIISPFPAGGGQTQSGQAGYASRKPKKLPCLLPHPAPACVCLSEACLKVRAETLELPKADSLANFAHD